MVEVFTISASYTGFDRELDAVIRDSAGPTAHERGAGFSVSTQIRDIAFDFDSKPEAELARRRISEIPLVSCRSLGAICTASQRLRRTPFPFSGDRNCDSRPHEESRYCPCHPKVEEVEGGSAIVIHNSWDGREITERAIDSAQQGKN